MTRRIRLSDIKIKNSFLESVPSETKLKECRKNYIAYGRQDRYIVVNSQNVLIDGYIMYLILKEQDKKYAQVIFSNSKRKCFNRRNTFDWKKLGYRCNPTTYIYGVHPNDASGKEYIWRISSNWKNKTNIHAGDLIVCNTKYGNRHVIVTKVKRFSECPVIRKVRKVVRKVENTDEY